MRTYARLTREEFRRVIKALPKNSRLRKRLEKSEKDMDKELDWLDVIGLDEEELHGDEDE